ncbi:MAG: multidrug ABC transporter ATP-binding protein, partial [Nitrospiraceae bacterium]
LFGRAIHLLSGDPEQDERRIRAALAANGIAVLSVATHPLSLEDVFVYRIMKLEQKERKTT